MSRLRLILGALAWLLVVQYVVVELLAVGAWTGTRYDLVGDVVSDLGRPDCLPEGGCSPLAAAFNGSLMLHGALVATGATLLAPLLPRWRKRVLALFLLTAAGNAMVGLFPLGAGVTTGHYLGATLAIGGATLAVATAGLALRRERPAFALLTAAATVVGVAGLALLVGDGVTGLAERVAIYPVVAWYVVTGALLLARPGTSDTADAGGAVEDDGPTPGPAPAPAR